MIRIIDGIKVTECITFPRTGHTWLRNLLADYFGQRWHYCEIHRDPKSLRIGPNTKTNFQKNHDFELKTEVAEDRQYLVSVRNPFNALISWRKFNDLEHNLTGGSGPEWKQETNQRLDFWTAWVKRWALNPISNRMVIFHEELCDQTPTVIANVVKFLEASNSVDIAQLDYAMKRHSPKLKCPNHYDEWRERVNSQ